MSRIEAFGREEHIFGEGRGEYAVCDSLWVDQVRQPILAPSPVEPSVAIGLKNTNELRRSRVCGSDEDSQARSASGQPGSIVLDGDFRA